MFTAEEKERAFWAIRESWLSPKIQNWTRELKRDEKRISANAKKSVFSIFLKLYLFINHTIKIAMSALKKEK